MDFFRKNFLGGKSAPKVTCRTFYASKIVHGGILDRLKLKNSYTFSRKLRETKKTKNKKWLNNKNV